MEITNLPEEVGKIIYEQLPNIIQKQPQVKFIIWEMLSEKFAPKEKTEDRFEKLLEKMSVYDEKFYHVMERIRILEEKSDRRFEEYNRKFERIFKKLEENDRKFKENDRKFDKIFKKLEENDRKFEQIFKKLEENDRRFEEQNRKFDEKFEKLLNKINSVDKRIDRTIGALGARWGLSSEHAFREAIKGVLETFTDTKVERYLAFDNEGIVFDWPDQVEIDVVIRNGKLCLMEIKSSTSKNDVYIFNRKAEFYKKETGKKVDKKIIVSPMFGPGALEIAKKLDIETYSAPEDMEYSEI